MYNVKVSGNKFIAYLVMLTKFAFILVGSGKVARLYDDLKYWRTGDERAVISAVWEGEALNHKRIQWTAECEEELLRLSRLAKPSKIG